MCLLKNLDFVDQNHCAITVLPQLVLEKWLFWFIAVIMSIGQVNLNKLFRELYKKRKITNLKKLNTLNIVLVKYDSLKIVSATKYWWQYFHSFLTRYFPIKVPKTEDIQPNGMNREKYLQPVEIFTMFCLIKLLLLINHWPFSVIRKLFNVSVI